VKRKQSFLFLIFFIFVISMFSVNAAISHVITGVLDIEIFRVDADLQTLCGAVIFNPILGISFAYEASRCGNLTNITSLRPYITIILIGENSTYPVNLSVWNRGGALNQIFSNDTLARNNSQSQIYFNGTLIDGYYTWRINITGNQSSNFVTGAQTNFLTNISNASQFRAIIIDSQAPNLTYLTSGVHNNLISTVNITTRSNVFINVSTNDTNGNGNSNTVVGGGSVVFELHNATGLLNITLFDRTVFFSGGDFVAANLSYKSNNDLVDGIYYYNITVNDSLGNKRVGDTITIYKDNTAPNISYNSNSAAQSANLTLGTIFINVSTNDTLRGKGQVGGGFVIFYLYNDSGLLDETTFARTGFAADLIQHNWVNVSYINVADLDEGYYFYNVTVNDSLNNNIVLAERNVTVDRTAPSSSYLNANTDGGTSSSSSIIFINVTSNDTLSRKGQVGGGFVSFYLRNQSGVINWSIRPRNVFAPNLVATNNLTFFLSGVGSSLSDGIYFFNASVNDSNGNLRWIAERNFTIDSVNPVVAITSSEGTTIKRLQSTTIACQATDMQLSNITVSIDGETDVFCSNYNGASSCTGTYISNTATTRTVTCTAYDMAARTTSTTLDIVIEQETTNGPPISQPGTGGGRRSSTIGDIVANQPFTMQIPANIAASLGVESITVLSTVNAPNAKLEVNGLSDAPSGVSIPGNVYKYLEIRKTNLADSALKEAVVVSLVKKEWIQQNNVNPSNIVLFRLKDGVWERYTPSNVQEKDGTYRFEAKVPGFSTFAIGVDKQSGQTPADATTNDGTSTGDNAADTTTEENVEKTSLMPVLVIILVLIVIGAVVWYLVGRKKH